MSEATLLFGMGATKAGTSWLYRYLAGHPECHMRSIKELHFFDALDEGRVEQQMKALNRQKARLERRQAGGSTNGLLERAARLADIEEYQRVLTSGSEKAYMAYLDAGRGDHRLIADITPAYSLLSVGRLTKMAKMASTVRFVYLMRDPVSRLWSHVRMLATRRADTEDQLPTLCNQIMDDVLAGRKMDVVTRGDYQSVMGRLREALVPTSLFTGFYEELFTQQSISRLCAFLGLSDRPADFSRRVHEGASVAMSAEQKGRAAAFLKPQYDFVEACFGRLPDQWAANRVGV